MVPLQEEVRVEVSDGRDVRVGIRVEKVTVGR